MGKLGKRAVLIAGLIGFATITSYAQSDLPTATSYDPVYFNLASIVNNPVLFILTIIWFTKNYRKSYPKTDGKIKVGLVAFSFAIVFSTFIYLVGGFNVEPYKSFAETSKYTVGPYLSIAMYALICTLLSMASVSTIRFFIPTFNPDLLNERLNTDQSKPVVKIDVDANIQAPEEAYMRKITESLREKDKPPRY